MCLDAEVPRGRGGGGGFHVGQRRLSARGHFGEAGADDSHFNRPTFMDWLPDGTFFVTDQEGFWTPKNRMHRTLQTIDFFDRKLKPAG